MSEWSCLIINVPFKLENVQKIKMCILNDHPSESHIWVFGGFLFLFCFPLVLLLCLCYTNSKQDCVIVSSGIRSSQVFPISIFKQEMLKCSKNSEGTAELEEALATVLDIIKSVNDSMHQIAITGYEVIAAAAPALVWAMPCSCHHWSCCAHGWYSALWSLCHSWRMPLSGKSTSRHTYMWGWVGMWGHGGANGGTFE